MDKIITRLAVDYKKEGVSCHVVIKFTAKTRTATLFLDEKVESEDTYMYVDEMDKFIHDNILTDKKLIEKKSKSGSGSTDEQCVLWKVRIYFEDESWVMMESFENNPYTPDYWNEFITLLEK